MPRLLKQHPSRTNEAHRDSRKVRLRPKQEGRARSLCPGNSDINGPLAQRARLISVQLITLEPFLPPACV